MRCRRGRKKGCRYLTDDGCCYTTEEGPEAQDSLLLDSTATASGEVYPSKLTVNYCVSHFFPS